MMTGTSSFKELDEPQYLHFQKFLLEEKGGDIQRDFLGALRDNDDFISLFGDHGVEFIGETELPLFDEALTERSFFQPTVGQESRMYELWIDVPPRIASRVSFWAAVTLNHLKLGRIPEASWLAADRGSSFESGEERMDRALSFAGDKGLREVDSCVRTVFRRMSGLPTARGNRSVFVNPTFGRGWWRERILRRVSERNDVEQDQVALYEVVRRSPQYWENLVTMIVSRGSVFGSTDVQDALINSLAKHLAEHPETPLRSATALNTALRRFSNVAAAQELGVLEFGEICGIIDELILRIQGSYDS